MTIKELLIIVEQELSSYDENIDNNYLSEILEHYTMHERDWSDRPDVEALNDIHFEYATADSFDIKQLEKELELGFYVYYYVTDFDDMIIKHFENKVKAFNFYRKLSMDILVIDRLLIDTSKGIIVGGKRVGDYFKRKQYHLFREWIADKYPIGTKVKIIQFCNTANFAYLDRSSCIGRTGKVVSQDFTNIITLDIGEEETCPIEIGKDQIKIV